MFEILPNFQQFLQRFSCPFHYFSLSLFFYFSLTVCVCECVCVFSSTLARFVQSLLGCIKWAVVHATGFFPLVFVRFCKQQTFKLQWYACSVLIPPLFNLSCACQIFSWAHFIVHWICLPNVCELQSSTYLSIHICTMHMHVYMAILLLKKNLKTFT